MRRVPQLHRSGELVVVIDCSDLARSARFWSGVLGFTAGRVTSGPYRSLVPESGEGIEVLLQQVPEGKCRKHRLHLDLRTADVDTEVRRVLGLGATLITDQAVMEDGWRWHILADPDGNEFCVLQPPGSSQSTASARRASAATRGCQWPPEAARRWENDRHVGIR